MIRRMSMNRLLVTIGLICITARVSWRWLRRFFRGRRGGRQRSYVAADEAVAKMNPPVRVVGFLIASLAAVPLWPTASSAEDAKAPPAPAVRCEEALVNPVSGHAECVKPRGAAVDPPPPRPPPSPEVCARHPELNVADCRPAKPQGTP